VKTIKTDEQIETRLDWLERQIAAERNVSTLASLNRCFQLLIDEQVRRDMLKEEGALCPPTK
jgi:hypothetical protein